MMQGGGVDKGGTPGVPFLPRPPVPWHHMADVPVMASVSPPPAQHPGPLCSTRLSPLHRCGAGPPYSTVQGWATLGGYMGGKWGFGGFSPGGWGVWGWPRPPPGSPHAGSSPRPCPAAAATRRAAGTATRPPLTPSSSTGTGDPGCGDPPAPRWGWGGVAAVGGPLRHWVGESPGLGTGCEHWPR